MEASVWYSPRRWKLGEAINLAQNSGRQAGRQNMGTSINKGSAKDMCYNNKVLLFLHSVCLKENPL